MERPAGVWGSENAKDSLIIADCGAGTALMLCIKASSRPMDQTPFGRGDHCPGLVLVIGGGHGKGGALSPLLGVALTRQGMCSYNPHSFCVWLVFLCICVWSIRRVDFGTLVLYVRICPVGAHSPPPPPPRPTTKECIRREGASEAAPEAVTQVVG